MKQPLFCLQLCSDDIDTNDAMSEILSDAQTQLSGNDYGAPKGGMVFFDVEYDAEDIIQSIYAVWPDIQLIGCSSYGEFNTKSGMHDGSIHLMLFGGNIDCYVRSFPVEERHNIDDACNELIDIPQTPTVSFLFSEAIESFCVEDAIEHLQQKLPKDHVIIGGMAADDYEFTHTTQIANHIVQHAGCVMMHLCGDIAVATSTSLGWSSLGNRGLVTKAEGSIVYEIDHKPALDFFLDETGCLSTNTLQPLTVYSPDGELLYNRTPLGEYTPEHKVSDGIFFIGKIPEGNIVSLSNSDIPKLLEPIVSDIKSTYESFPKDREAAFSLFFSCASRRVLLSSETPKEADEIIKALPYPMPGMGFYTFGEVGKMTSKSSVAFHNNSLVYAFVG